MKTKIKHQLWLALAFTLAGLATRISATQTSNEVTMLKNDPKAWIQKQENARFNTVKNVSGLNNDCTYKVLSYLPSFTFVDQNGKPIINRREIYRGLKKIMGNQPAFQKMIKNMEALMNEKTKEKKINPNDPRYLNNQPLYAFESGFEDIIENFHESTQTTMSGFDKKFSGKRENRKDTLERLKTSEDPLDHLCLRLNVISNKNPNNDFETAPIIVTYENQQVNRIIIIATERKARFYHENLWFNPLNQISYDRGRNTFMIAYSETKKDDDENKNPSLLNNINWKHYLVVSATLCLSGGFIYMKLKNKR